MIARAHEDALLEDGREASRRSRSLPGGGAMLKSLSGRPRDRDDAVAREPEQRDDREHERRRRRGSW